MATIKRRKGTTGAVSFLAMVRVKRFKAASKTFRVETTVAEAKQRAEAWAEALERELRGQASRGGTRSDVTQLTIGGLIAEYLRDPETQALRTYKEVQRLLESFWVNKYAAERILDFGVRTLLDARDRLNTGDRSPGTVNRYLGVMRSVWSWGRATGLIPMERAWPSRLMLTEPRGRKRFLSDAEMSALLFAAEKDPVMRAAIVVSLSSGLRQGELLGLAWGDIDLVRGQCTVRDAGRHTTRNADDGEWRVVHLTPTAVGVLADLKKATVVRNIDPAKSPVFITASGGPLRQSYLERRWQRIRAAAKLVDFRWHDLRHSCASILLQSGATLGQVGQVLGHRSPSMTMRYAHLVAGAPVVGHDKLDAKLRGK
jgi:integrase